MLSIYHWKMLTSYCLVQNKCKVIPKGMAVQLPPNNWNKIPFIIGKCLPHIDKYENKCKVVPKGIAIQLPPHNM